MPDEMTTVFAMSHPAEICFPPALFEKRKATERAEPRWELTLLMAQDHPDVAAIKSLCRRIAESKMPGITASPTAWKYPWSQADAFIARQEAKGGKQRDNEFMRGKLLFNSHTVKFEPRLSVFMPGRGAVDYWTDEMRATVKDKFYAGCEVLCEYAFVWYPPNNGIPGVTAYINKVLSLNKGERRGGGKSSTDTFSAYLGKYSAIDPTYAAGDQVEY